MPILQNIILFCRISGSKDPGGEGHGTSGKSTSCCLACTLISQVCDDLMNLFRKSKR